MASSTNLRFAIFIPVFVVGCIFLVIGAHWPNSEGGPRDVTLSEADLQANDQAKALIATANGILGKMKVVCIEQGLRWIGPDEFHPTSGRIQQREGEEVVGPQLQLQSKDYTFEFWMENNELSLFIDQALQDRLYGKGAPQLDRPDSPKLTELEAKQRAKSLLGLIEIPDGIKLGVAKARFEPQTQLTVYRPGWWDVAWARTDAEGHPFACDPGLSMDMPEGFGPISIHVGLRMPYTKEDGNMLSQEAALAAARAEIDRSRAGFVTTPIPNDVGIVDDKLADSNLTIVEAIAEWPWWMCWSKPKKTTRLAWRFYFEPEFTAPVASPTHDRRFTVSIDAHTGEVLSVAAASGGDSP